MTSPPIGLSCHGECGNLVNWTRVRSTNDMVLWYPNGHTLISNVSRQEQVNSCGFSLLELVITLTILVILTLGVIPLVEATMKRQREQSLREALREIRSAIDEFHRDTVGMQCVGVNGSNINTQVPGQSPDPRSRVVIADCTVFTVDNPDHY